MQICVNVPYSKKKGSWSLLIHMLNEAAVNKEGERKAAQFFAFGKLFLRFVLLWGLSLVCCCWLWFLGFVVVFLTFIWNFSEHASTYRIYPKVWHRFWSLHDFNFSVLMQAVPQADHTVAMSTDGKNFTWDSVVCCVFLFVCGFCLFCAGEGWFFLENRKPRILCNHTVIT